MCRVDDPRWVRVELCCRCGEQSLLDDGVKVLGLLTLAGPGFDAATADQLKPNRARYRELRAKTPDKSGSMQSDGV